MGYFDNMMYKTVLVICLTVIMLIFVQGCITENQGDNFYNYITHSNSINEKICVVRGDQYTRRLWNQITGYYCYLFTNPYRMRFQYKFYNTIEDNQIVWMSLALDNSTFFLYDYENSTSLQHIRLSYKSDEFFDMWKSCSQEAAYCCDNFMDSSNIYPNENYQCPANWDAWTCFHPAKANTTSKMPCSKQAYSTNSEVCVLESEKKCTSGGWNQNTNYEVCSIAPVYRTRHHFHITALAIGVGLSFPSVVIFLSFANLRAKTRVALHRNLIIFIIVRSLLTIMSKKLVILEALDSIDGNSVMVRNGAPCRVLAFFENAAKNGLYAAMLADGFYLHKLIVRAFAPEPNLFILYGIVSVLTFVPSLAWATTRAVHDGADCWMADDSQDQWITDGFRITILVINLLLLLDIIRVMIMKLKTGSTSKQTMATFRATLLLVPLFGLHIIVITDRNIVPPGSSCTAEDIYYYVSYLMEATQGVVVAILFCYLNAEVHGELKNAFRKINLHLEQKFGWNLRRETLARRRTTAATYVDPDEEFGAKEKKRNKKIFQLFTSETQA